jgi:antitoxin component YwqK of YwqJK toxin-antitoxin module
MIIFTRGFFYYFCEEILNSKIVKKIFLVLVYFISILSLSAQEVTMKKGKYYGADGKLYSGLYKEYDINGKLIAENRIDKGLPDGISDLYFPKGNKKEQRSYKQGKKDGLWTTWDSSGMKTAEARFTNGIKDGFWYIWDENGTKRYEMFYIKGEKKGKWFIWDENGKLVTEQNYGGM